MLNSPTFAIAICLLLSGVRKYTNPLAEIGSFAWPASRRIKGGPATRLPTRPRIVIRVRRLFRATLALRHVPKVHPNARPRRVFPAHRVDEHIVLLQQIRRLRMPRFPPFESLQRILPVLRLRHRDQRVFRLPPPAAFRPFVVRLTRTIYLLLPRRLHPRRLVGRLLVLRRPRRVAHPLSLLLLHQFEQPLKRPRCLVDPRRCISSLCKPLRRRFQRELRRIAVRHLVPVERHRNARIRRRPHRPRGRHCPVLGVLVVVDKDAVPLLLPPLARRQLWRSPLHRARQRHRRPPHLVEPPAPLDAHVHVHPARPRRLRPSPQP